MNSDIPPDVLARHRDRIAAFVRGARRVESHSLLQSTQQFQSWAEGSITVTWSKGGGLMTQHVPPEEAFESLASRCRPFLLQGEQVNWRTVFGSLKAFLKQDEQFGQLVESLRCAWADAEAPPPDTGFAVIRPDEVESQAVWFGTLADSWLYGDLVHASPEAREKAQGHTLNERYCAAVLLYGQVALQVVATLNLIRKAIGAGLIAVDEQAWSTPVTVKVPMQTQLSGWVLADADTLMQEMIDAFKQATRDNTETDQQ